MKLHSVTLMFPEYLLSYVEMSELFRMLSSLFICYQFVPLFFSVYLLEFYEDSLSLVFKHWHQWFRSYFIMATELLTACPKCILIILWEYLYWTPRMLLTAIGPTTEIQCSLWCSWTLMYFNCLIWPCFFVVFQPISLLHAWECAEMTQKKNEASFQEPEFLKMGTYSHFSIHFPLFVRTSAFHWIKTLLGEKLGASLFFFLNCVFLQNIWE